MANVGVNLSKKCIQALVDDGLITKQEVIVRAAKEGIVVRDGPNGLYVDTNAKIGQEVVTVEQPKETIVAKEVPVTEKITTSVKTGVKKTKSAVTKAASSVKASAQKAATAVKTQYKKAATAVKKKYQKVTKSNKEYAGRSYIQKQNELRRKYIAGRNIAPEGINASFGRYEIREPGFVPPTKYSFKKHMEDHNNGMIRSEGINAQFDRN
jgi:hypothetical protein